MSELLNYEIKYYPFHILNMIFHILKNTSRIYHPIHAFYQNTPFNKGT